MLCFWVGTGVSAKPENDVLKNDVLKNNVPKIDYSVIQERNHNPKLFTQGFLIVKDWIYESSGRYGQSLLARYKEENGEGFYSQKLPDDIFAEGLTFWNNSFYLITWRNQTAYRYDEYWSQKQTFHYQGEGWGLTHTDTQLIMSNGSDQLQFINPDDFSVEKTLTVTGYNRTWDLLNELEYHNGIVWANRWLSDELIAIDATTGNVLGTIDLTELAKPYRKGIFTSDKVANGIAWSEQHQAFWITGKYWPKRYLIKIPEQYIAAQIAEESSNE